MDTLEGGCWCGVDVLSLRFCCIPFFFHQSATLINVCCRKSLCLVKWIAGLEMIDVSKTHSVLYLPENYVLLLKSNKLMNLFKEQNILLSNWLVVDLCGSESEVKFTYFQVEKLKTVPLYTNLYSYLWIM